MKFEAVRPSKILLVVDHIALVCLTVGRMSASVANIDVAERRLALSVAVVLADMKLSIMGNYEQRRVFVRRLSSQFVAPAPFGLRLLHHDL